MISQLKKMVRSVSRTRGSRSPSITPDGRCLLGNAGVAPPAGVDGVIGDKASGYTWFRTLGPEGMCAASRASARCRRTMPSCSRTCSKAPRRAGRGCPKGRASAASCWASAPPPTSANTAPAIRCRRPLRRLRRRGGGQAVRRRRPALPVRGERLRLAPSPSRTRTAPSSIRPPGIGVLLPGGFCDLPRPLSARGAGRARAGRRGRHRRAVRGRRVSYRQASAALRLGSSTARAAGCTATARMCSSRCWKRSRRRGAPSTFPPSSRGSRARCSRTRTCSAPPRSSSKTA